MNGLFICTILATKPSVGHPKGFFSKGMPPKNPQYSGLGNDSNLPRTYLHEWMMFMGNRMYMYVNISWMVWVRYRTYFAGNIPRFKFQGTLFSRWGMVGYVRCKFFGGYVRGQCLFFFLGWYLEDLITIIW